MAAFAAISASAFFYFYAEPGAFFGAPLIFLAAVFAVGVALAGYS
jgi:uncharacterized membrane protein